MTIPDFSSLNLRDTDSDLVPAIPQDIIDPSGGDRYFEKLKIYAKCLPYSIESNSRMQEFLDLILRRIVQCVEAKDYDPGLLQWDILFT